MEISWDHRFGPKQLSAGVQESKERRNEVARGTSQHTSISSLSLLGPSKAQFKVKLGMSGGDKFTSTWLPFESTMTKSDGFNDGNAAPSRAKPVTRGAISTEMGDEFLRQKARKKKSTSSNVFLDLMGETAASNTTRFIGALSWYMMGNVLLSCSTKSFLLVQL